MSRSRIPALDALRGMPTPIQTPTLSRRVSSPIVRFFCAEGSAVDLAVFRVVLFSVVAYMAARGWDYAWFAALQVDLQSPPLFGGWLVVDARLVRLAQPLCILASMGAALGLFTRASAITATVAALYLLGIPQQFGKVDHYNHLVWFAAILAASPCGDALSVDQWRRGGTQLPAVRSRAYALPLRFVWVLMGMCYLFPGFAKLGVGPAWYSADNMRNMLDTKWLELPGSHPALEITHPLLLTVSGLATILFEATWLPVLLFAPRSRWYLVPAGILFHTMTALTMGISFWLLQVCYVALVGWDRRGNLQPVRHRTSPITRVGVALVAANWLFGAFAIDSWPFTIYPTFAYLTPAVARPESVSYPEIAAKMGTARWARMLARAARDPRTARGLAQLIEHAHHAPATR